MEIIDLVDKYRAIVIEIDHTNDIIIRSQKLTIFRDLRDQIWANADKLLKADADIMFGSWLS